MDISNIELGQRIEGLTCQRCKEKEIRRTGRQNDKSYIECFSCFLGGWVDNKEAKIEYESKEEKLEAVKSEKEEKKSRGRRRAS